jgi:hypothetical protein
MVEEPVALPVIEPRKSCQPSTFDLGIAHGVLVAEPVVVPLEEPVIEAELSVAAADADAEAEGPAPRVTGFVVVAIVLVLSYKF